MTEFRENGLGYLPLLAVIVGSPTPEISQNGFYQPKTGDKIIGAALDRLYSDPAQRTQIDAILSEALDADPDIRKALLLAEFCGAFGQKKSQSELSLEFGVTPARIRQMRKDEVAKLRKLLLGPNGELRRLFLEGDNIPVELIEHVGVSRENLKLFRFMQEVANQPNS